MSNIELEAGYQQWFIAGAYDALAGTVFAPVGGVTALRRAALDHFRIARGERVLELGCGSGGVTRLLSERGARVTAVDWSGPMLRRAERRAPTATFERSEITAFEPPAGESDVVLFSFVLHELDEADRATALAIARRALHPEGRLAIVDHALPERGLVARAMSRFVHGFEPGTSTSRWLHDGGPEAEIERAGFSPSPRTLLAEGLAFALVASPSTAGSLRR